MTGKFKLEPFWNDENFAVQRGVIRGSATVSGANLGRGFIYHPVDAHLTHRLPDRIETEISCPVGDLAFLYNPGTDAEIMNLGAKSADIYRVTLNYPEQLINQLPADYIGLATSVLLQGDWSDDFKASVKMDLECIHRLVPTGLASEPSPDDILVASLAKDDLELKLSWLSSWLRFHKTPLLSFNLSGIIGLQAAGPPPGKITVTATTEDQMGQAVSGCRVWANLRGYQNNTAHAQAFGKLSSPTTDNLAVANYNMWAEKGGRKGPMVSIGIAGGASPTAQSVDLIAP